MFRAALCIRMDFGKLIRAELEEAISPITEQTDHITQKLDEIEGLLRELKEAYDRVAPVIGAFSRLQQGLEWFGRKVRPSLKGR
jgi:hypothetical protein